jgi:RNA polymerase sigma factor (sigma-70 family)
LNDDAIVMDSWIGRLQNGDNAAAEDLWQRYYQKMVRIAYKRLSGSTRTMADEEDVVVSAFKSFFRAMEENRTPKLQSEDEIWRLLVTLTARKAIKLIRYESRDKRQGEAGKLQHNAVPIDELIGSEPSPEFVLAVADEYRQLNKRLLDDEMRLIALHKMEGYSNAEIAQQLNTNLRTVQRRLAVIRSLLVDALDEEED